MDERLRFVARLLEGESMSEVIIGRDTGGQVTGYKIFTRYRDQGMKCTSYDLI
jgi:hypothetical protein